MKWFIRFFIVYCLFASGAAAVYGGPYPPAAGQPESTAVSMDDPEIVGWATGWTDYHPGEDVDAGWQTPEKAVGPAVGDSFDIVCLGRGGAITMAFDPPVSNGPGWDFAVFENGFSDAYLELAYVEASSDGNAFYRFPNDSLTPAPVGGFGTIDPTNVDGLASKYRQGFGTPFDLDDLAAADDLDPDRISYVRFIDIVGDGSCRDTGGDVIYDPYPTATTAGLDLEAVAVRHHAEPEPVPGDYDGDGKITLADVLGLLQVIAGAR